jgi:hypothetical protein
MAKQEKNKIIPQKFTEEERSLLKNTLGIVFGLMSKAILQEQGFEVNYKINGEDISFIDKLSGLDLTERLNLAVREERYEDAAVLKKMLLNRPAENNEAAKDSSN